MSKSPKADAHTIASWHQATLSPDALHLLIQGMPLPMIVTHLKEARLLMANDAATLLLSRPGKPFLGESTLALGLWPSPLARAQILRRLEKETVITDYRMTLRDGTGAPRPGSASLCPLFIDGVPCLITTFQEDEQEKPAEDPQQESETRLRYQLQAQKMEAIGHLSSALAHDFNNILAAIMLRLELLALETEPSEAICTAINELGTEAKRASSITRQLLLFSRREAALRHPMDLGALINHASETLAHLICPGIQIDLPTPLPPLWIEGDPALLEQVLMHLIANARDSMADGGRITVRLALVSVPPNHPCLPPGKPPRQHACLMVADQGCGMDEHLRSHIFEPFFTTKPAGKGSGMGLATVYGIIQQHHGWVEVDSKPQRGSVFSLFLPVMENAGLSPPPEKPQLPSRRILIVEDDPSIRRISSLILQQRGFLVIEATTGKEGLALWGRHRTEIHLVLADLVLPDGLLGLDLVEEVHRTAPKVPCILMSGFDTDTEQQLALPEECAYLHKPFDTPTLIREVLKALATCTP